EQIAGDELDVIAGGAHGHGVLFTIQLHLQRLLPARESGPAEVSPVASNLWTLARTALRIRIAHILRPWSSPSSGPATSGVLTARSFFWPRACHSHCPTLLPTVVRRGGSQRWRTRRRAAGLFSPVVPDRVRSARCSQG